MDKLKILFLSAEVEPYSKTGGLADVAGALPFALARNGGCEVRVVSPYYGMTRKSGHSLEEILKVSGGRGPGGTDAFEVLGKRAGGVRFYFIKKDEYYDRPYIYGTPQGDYPDNLARFSLFCKAALESAARVGFYPDIIHTNDWETALVPLYLKDLPAGHSLKTAKVLYSIHNLAYQGTFSVREASVTGLAKDTLSGISEGGSINLMKAGIRYAHAISTVSKGYARQILTAEYGCALEGELKKRKEELYGISNGVDYTKWDPSTDDLISRNYDIDSLEDKDHCKADLKKETDLDISADTPLIGSVGRLTEQKGIDIIIESMEKIVSSGFGMVLLGAGDAVYEKRLKGLGAAYKGKFTVKIGFDNTLAHKIEAGSDIFVIPSRYEPCGLNQMYSLRYGTIPVVRATGGLDDTITDYTDDPEKGNGFKFEDASSPDFMDALRRALKSYRDKSVWRMLQKRGMELDFSWERSADEYLALYRRLKGDS